MYFNGGLHGFNGPKGYIPAKPTTKLYCDACAPTNIPLWGVEAAAKPGQHTQPHYGTDFRWAPYFGGDAICSACGCKV
jgi:hypothetical protein